MGSIGKTPHGLSTSEQPQSGPDRIVVNGSQSRRVFLAAVVVCVLAFAGVIAALGIENAMLIEDATGAVSGLAAPIAVNTSGTADQQLTLVANDIASSSADMAQVAADISGGSKK